LLAEELGCCEVLDGATYGGSITCSVLGPRDPKFIDLEKIDPRRRISIT